LKSVAGSGVRIAKLENPTYAQLRKAIDGDWKQDDAIFGAPDILHFIGHGKEGSLALMMSSDEADYDDTSNEEQFRWAEADQVRKLFTKHRPRLVFLHACKGAASTSVESFNSTARELVYEGIAAVVAMQYNISNTDAGLFARKFYEELGKGTDIDESVKIGRLALGEIYPAWAHPRFGTPVVYVQAYDPLVKARQPAGAPTGAADTASNARPAPRQELKGQATAAPAPTSAPATTQRDELIVGTTIKLDN
ncbi:MAG TPA: CHAT domain-containing protein, partial [Longimicrobiales bacterium]